MNNEYHPEIIEFDTTSLKREFSDSQNPLVFYNIPTDFIVSNFDRRELWKHCPPLVNFDMLSCINEIIERGEFPYNATVQSDFCAKFNIVDPIGEGTTFLSAMVYCTQKYHHEIQDEENAKRTHEELTREGFVKSTEEIFKNMANSKNKAFVVLSGTNIFGSSTSRKSDKPLYLKRNGDGFIWMAPRATRKGYIAMIGQYIKAA